MLIHSQFPCLIHMLFGHNTSRLHESSIKAASFTFTPLQVVCRHYGALVHVEGMLQGFLKVASHRDCTQR